jgi:DNA-binding Xre family transcriptional regulator
MAIRWTFKQYLAAKHQVYTATELQKRVVKATGVVISVAQLCKLVNARPQQIRLETAEILCSALSCELHDFLKITAREMNPNKKRKLSYKNTPHSKIASRAFPSPADYKPRSAD